MTNKLWTPGSTPVGETNTHGIGARIGPRIAKVVTDAQEHSLWRTSGMRSKQGADAANLFFHGINRELRNVLAPLLHTIADHPELAPEVKALADFVARQPGEGAALMGLAATGIGYASGLGTVIADLFAPVIQDLLRVNPNLILPSDVWVQAATKRLIHESLLKDALGRQGIDGEQADLWLRTASTYPDLTTILDLRRRQVIDRDTSTRLMQRQGFTDADIEWMHALVRVILSPADAADMVVRGLVTEDEGAAIAAQSGVDVGDFRLLVEDTGEPPGIMQLLEAYRRGFIDKRRLEHGIRQSRVKNEWIDTVERLRFSPMDISTAARAVVQNYMTPAEADRIAEANGLEPGQMHTIVLVQGEPLGHQQMAELYNRRLITLSQFEQAIRESHVKDKYIKAATELRRRLLPERQIVTALGHGALSDHDAMTHLQEDGYNATDAKILIDSGRGAATGREKELAKSDVLTLYIEYSIDRTQAHKLLRALGYVQSAAEYILDIADFRRTAQDINHVMTVLHKLYVERWITETDLRTDLAHLGVPGPRIDRALPLWTLERDAVHRHLTEAQVARAVKLGTFTVHQGLRRLEAMGYSTADATVLLEDV